MSPRRLLFAPVVLLAACAPDADAPQAIVALALPQSIGTPELARLVLTQLGEVHTRDVSGDGVVRVQVLAGVPLDIELTVLRVTAQPPLVEGWFGRASVLPTPGTRRVELEAERLASRDGSFVPAFVLDGQVTALLRGAVTLRDVETDHTLSLRVPVGEVVSLPEGRLLEASYERPVAPLGSYSRLVATSRLAPSTIIDIGPPPATPTAPLFLGAAGPMDLRAALAGLGLEVECARALPCGAATGFGPSVDLPAGVDGRFRLNCRFTEAKPLCFPVTLVTDDTPPALELRPRSSFLLGDAGSLLVDVVGDEPLDPDSLSLRQLPAGPILPCAGREILSDRAVRCELDVSSITGDVELEVTATDSAPGAPRPRARAYRMIPRVPATTEAAAVAVRLYPAETGPRGEFLAGVELVGLGPACTVTLEGVTLAPPSGGPPPTSTVTTTFSPASVTLAAATPAAPATATWWGRVSGPPAGDQPDGTYTATITYRATCAVSSPATLGVSLVPPPPRWLTGDGRLVIPDRLGAQPTPSLTRLPLVSQTQYPDVSTSDPAVVGVSQTPERTSASLEAAGLGVALLTAKEPTSGASDVVEIEVARRSGVAFLQHDPGASPPTWVVRLDPERERLDVTADIGTPLRLLWEPGTDALVAVGKTGAQIFDASGARVVSGPLAGPVLDAAVLPGRTAADEPVLVMLADTGAGTVELTASLATGALVGAPLAIADAACAGGPTRLALSPVTGERVAWGNGCAFSYRPEPAGTRVLAVPVATDAERLILDPYGAYAVALAPGGRVHALSAGATLARHGELPVGTGTAPRTATALALDATTGTPLVAAFNGQAATVEAYDYRFQIAASRSLGTAPGSVPIGHLLADAGSQVLYLVTAEAAPRLFALLQEDALPPARVADPLFGAAAVVDGAVLGPQVTGVDPEIVAPGGVVTLRGLGFAGGGVDEVYVQGVRAEVLSSTTTHVVARVPAALGRVTFGIESVTCAARSHGRIAQPRSRLALATRPPLRRLEDLGLSLCSGGCGSAPVVVAQSRTSGAAVTDGRVFRIAPEPQLLASFGARAAGYDVTVDRVVGWHPDYVDPKTGAASPGWLDWRTGLDEPHRIVSIDLGGLPSLGSVLLEPTGRLIASGADDADAAVRRVGLYYAPTLVRASAPWTTTLGAELAFLPDGATLVALGRAGTSATLAAWEVAGNLAAGSAPPSVPATLDPGCPAAATVELLGVFPYTRFGAELLVVLADAGSLVTGRVSRDAAGVRLTCGPVRAEGRALGPAALLPSGEALVVGVDVGLARLQHLLLVDPEDPGVELATVALTRAPARLYPGLMTSGESTSRAVVYGYDDATSTLSAYGLTVLP